jgi:hypothetical protein
MAEQPSEGGRERQADEAEALARRLRESREYLGLSQESVPGCPSRLGVGYGDRQTQSQQHGAA